jgi:hypothetical protein
MEEKEAPVTQKDGDKKRKDKKKEDLEKREIDQEDLLGLGVDAPAQVSSPTTGGSTGGSKAVIDDLLNIGLNDESPAPTQSQFTFPNKQQPQGSGINDFLDLSGNTGGNLGAFGGSMVSNSTFKQPTMEIVLPRMQSGMSGKNGVEIMGCVQRGGNGFSLHLNFRTMVPAAITINQIGIMSNSMGLSGNYPMGSCGIPPNGAADVIVPLFRQGTGHYTSMLNLQISTSYDSYISSVPIYPHIFGSQQAVTIDEFKQGWMSAQSSSADQPVIPPVLHNEEQLKQHFRQNGVFHLSTQIPGGNSKIS